MPPRAVLTLLTLAVGGVAALPGCGTADPLEQTICLRSADTVRLPSSTCERAAAPADGSVVTDPQTGQFVYWATAELACLDADDRTAIGQRADDDYLGEGCDDDDARRRSPVVVGPDAPPFMKTRTRPSAGKASIRPSATSSAAPPARPTTTPTPAPVKVPKFPIR